MFQRTSVDKGAVSWGQTIAKGKGVRKGGPNPLLKLQFQYYSAPREVSVLLNKARAVRSRHRSVIEAQNLQGHLQVHRALATIGGDTPVEAYRNAPPWRCAVPQLRSHL